MEYKYFFEVRDIAKYSFHLPAGGAFRSYCISYKKSLRSLTFLASSYLQITSDDLEGLNLWNYYGFINYNAFFIVYQTVTAAEKCMKRVFVFGFVNNRIWSFNRDFAGGFCYALYFKESTSYPHLTSNLNIAIQQTLEESI